MTITLGTIREDGCVYSDEYDGKARWLEKRICVNPICGKEYLAAKHRKTKYCSQSCQGSGKRNRESFFCNTCGKKISRAKSKVNVGKHGYNFCSRLCKEKAQSIDGHIPDIRPTHYGDGKTEYRQRAFKIHGSICNRCKYNEDDRMLDVHHIDGNRKNGNPANLEVLCVWCHALETRKDWPHCKFIN